MTPEAHNEPIAHCTKGHRYTLVFVSVVKRLLEEDLSSAHRLRFLEWLDNCSDFWLSADAIAAVEPMPDEGQEMVNEAQKLGAGKSLDVFASSDVFRAFVAVNPSLLCAIELSNARRGAP